MPFMNAWKTIATVAVLAVVLTIDPPCDTCLYDKGKGAPEVTAVEPSIANMELLPPVEGRPLYPFTKSESLKCERWRKGSQDYPYFGAPRDGNRRRHAGIDIYPEYGAGTPVKAIRDGTVLKTGAFYVRANREITYGVLIDHVDFIANYAELVRPIISAGERVKRGQTIGRISGTKQLHFELYSQGTIDWLKWYGQRPINLLDPTPMMLRVYDMYERKTMTQGSANSRKEFR